MSLRSTLAPLCSLALLLTLAACSDPGRPVSPGNDGGTTAGTDGGGTQTGQKNPVGGTCNAGSDCANGTCITGVPGGYCTTNCASSSCPSGSECAQVGQSQLCLATCRTESDCRGGYVCQEGACVPGCQRDADCGTGNTCDTSTGQCQTGSTMNPGSGNVGDGCTQSTSCTEGTQPQCITASQGFPGGYCVSTCSNTTACTSDAVCVGFQGSNNQQIDLCVKVCRSANDCRSGYTCQALQGGSTPISVCIPPQQSSGCQSNADCGSGQTCDTSTGQCTGSSNSGCQSNADCGGGAVCNTSTGQCEAQTTGGPVINTGVPADGGYAGTVTTNNAGTYNTSGGSTLTVSAPAGAVSTYITAVPPASFTGSIAAAAVYDPNGKEINAYSSDIATAYGQPLRTLPDDNSAYAVGIPNTTTLNYTPGDYGISFVSWDSSGNQTGTTLTVTTYTKTASAPLTGGTMDLNCWFASRTLTAATAPRNTNFQSVIKNLASFWAEFGVKMGNVTYHDLPAQYQQIATTDVGTLARQTNGNLSGVNVMFVDGLTDASQGGGYTILGVDPGIPGIPLTGTGASGALVSLYGWPSQTTNADMAAIVAHEIGHWLGLYHTSESPQGGALYDPLSDTPQCSSTTNSRNPDACPDVLYTMFYLANDGSTGTHNEWSSNQQFVMLRHPAVH